MTYTSKIHSHDDFIPVFAGQYTRVSAALTGEIFVNAAISHPEVLELPELITPIPNFPKLMIYQNYFPNYPRRNVINQITGWSPA